MWVSADQHEQCVSSNRFLFAAAFVGEYQLLEPALTIPTDHFSACPHVEIGCGLDFVDEVMRHPSVE